VPSVLITGCSSGFGLLSARMCAERGDAVFATVRDRSTASELRGLGAAGLPIRVVQLDVRDSQECAAAVAAVVEETGGIDALVNNAGVSMFAAIEEVDIDQASRMMETNYFGPLRLIRLVLPHMRRAGRGRIVNVSSIAGWAPAAYLGSYSATKHALDAMSFCLAAEVREFGIGVSVVSPGGFPTGVGGKFWRPEASIDDAPYRRKAEQMEAGWYTHVAGNDPGLVAEAIVECVHATDPPFRVFVGDDANALAQRRRELDDGALVELMATSLSDPASQRISALP
jgi:NAD(P)-dependent dehydrogenase (short-subunit alcohol dehydrogenase family)